MNFIEKHSKILAVALCACACGPVLSTVYAYETQPGWHGEGKNRSYVLESTRQEATGLTEINDELYYFDQDGKLQFGWQTVGNDVYYFTSEGTAATGKTSLQGTTYNFQEDGMLLQGWQDDGTYFNDQGEQVKASWMEIDGVKYYFDAEGYSVTGWQDIEGKKYYFNEDGSMATGQVTVDGTTYHLTDAGELKTGWITEGDNSFYYNENGEQVKDQSIDIEGKKYFFDANGVMLKDTTKDGYTIASDGVATETVEESAPVQEETQTQAPAQSQEQTQTPAQSTPQTPSNSVSNNGSSSNSAVQQPQAPSNSGSVNTGSVSSSAIASAALAQVGVNQDCTMLVTNALKAVGINFHGWPSDYASLGSWTSNPVPGDIIIYSGHVAIYIGNGQAVHGGWNGYTTVVFSVNCSNALVGYIHVG